jgi:phospholipase C
MSDRNERRRDFLKLAAGAAAGSAGLSPVIAKALDLPARRATGTIKDVEHVVILMQENRSFDHYFGTLRGVRGYGDPRPIRLPSGAPVWQQPGKAGQSAVGPFHLDTKTTSAQTIQSLDHSWKGTNARWRNHDAWVPAKGPMTMGYFTRADIPFYYALADAFTICDGYHCSIFGPTSPNRLFLFTGTSGLAVGAQDSTVVTNSVLELSETADPANDSKRFKGFTWPTYAERLQAAGVSWQVYQEYNNYGDNSLSFFANFRGIGPEHELYKRGRAWSPGSNAGNAATSQGEHLVAQFEADVAADRLPQVSWIVPSQQLSEHPESSPAAGEYLTARLIAALIAHPEVWAKTVVFLNYDENDGFFDHLPPMVPAAGTTLGKSTADTAGEVYRGEAVGLGPRVPMLAVSPWSKGGFVNSQLFDHTSVIRFLETRFGVAEPNITPWRRAVTGDLTSVFDFSAGGGRAPRALPDASGLPAKAAGARHLPAPKPKGLQAPPGQEPGLRPARALPYAFEVSGRATSDGFQIDIANTGAAGAGFILYPAGGEPRYYTVEAGKRLSDVVPIEAGGYAMELHGPNGFLRGFDGGAKTAGVEADARFDPATGRLSITLRNSGAAPASVAVAPNNYLRAAARQHRLAPGAEQVDVWDIAPSGHWYDFKVTSTGDGAFERRIAGHGENGRPSISDPALGRRIA